MGGSESAGVRIRCVLLACGVLMAGISGFAADVVVVAIDHGNALRPLARFENGRWVVTSAAAERTHGQMRWVRWSASAAPVSIETSSEPTERCVLRVAAPNQTRARPDAAVGIATIGDTRAVPVQALARNSTEWQRIERTLPRLFERRERDQRLTATDAPPSVDAAYVASAASSRVYYIEASKRIPDTWDGDPDVDPRGTLRVTVSGWLRESRGDLLPIATKSELHWQQDDVRGPQSAERSLLPVGVLASGAQQVWVMGTVSPPVRFTLYDIGQSTALTLVTWRETAC